MRSWAVFEDGANWRWLRMGFSLAAANSSSKTCRGPLFAQGACGAPRRAPMKTGYCVVTDVDQHFDGFQANPDLDRGGVDHRAPQAATALAPTEKSDTGALVRPWFLGLAQRAGESKTNKPPVRVETSHRASYIVHCAAVVTRHKP